MNEINPNPQEPPQPPKSQSPMGRLEPKRLPPRDDAPRRIRPDEIFSSPSEDDYDKPTQRPAYHRNPNSGSYEQERSNMKQGGMTDGLIKIVGVALVVAAIVSYITVPMWGVNPTNYKTDITNIVGDIATMKTNVSSATANLKTTSDAIPNQINTALSNAMTQINSNINAANSNAQAAKDLATTANNQANNANTQINTQIAAVTKAYTDQITVLSKTVTDQKAMMDIMTTNAKALSDRVTVLETKAITPTATSKNVSATVKVQNSVMFATAPVPVGTGATSPSTLVSSFRINLVNNTNVAVSDLVLDIVVAANINPSDIQSMSMTGGGTIWQVQGQFTGQPEFVNTQWGLNLDANQSKTLYLTLTVTGNVPTPPAVTPAAVDFTQGVYRVQGGVAYNVDVTVQ